MGVDLCDLGLCYTFKLLSPFVYSLGVFRHVVLMCFHGLNVF